MPERGPSKPQPQPIFATVGARLPLPLPPRRLQWLGRPLHRARIAADLTVSTQWNGTVLHRTRPLQVLTIVPTYWPPFAASMRVASVAVYRILHDCSLPLTPAARYS